MRRGRRKSAAAVLAIAAIGAVGAVAATSSSAASTPITIGWAYDATGSMAPFDMPALAAAQLRVKQINAKGGVSGHPLKIATCKTQGNKPAVAKACALKLISGGAKVVFSTCDVDLGAPVVQEAINRGILAVSPCIGTDQMGPKRFGKKGALAFSYGNVAQDEGSAMADFAWSKGWKTAALATDGVIVYFKDVVAAFKARFQQLGGKIADEETYHSLGGHDVNNTISRLQGVKADVIVTATAGAFGALSTLVSGLRSAGDNTPILNSWAGDGTYWLPKSPAVTNYWYVTFASVFGDDPNPTVKAMAKQIKAATGGFVTGPAAIDGVATAIRRAHGSTDGAKLASIMQSFKDVSTLSGEVSFSSKWHTVFGRQYRVMSINDNKAKFVKLIRAKVVPTI
ncbi:MAG TPA: ABC transporter substrate-binding protein [Solirubrobacteraceae bacterium]|jgi:branched-chain amino acid transport system substrate-binding protein|nr:ABC transporter substrate-binding protein [Solirubrobacteraceae bacterium]